MQIIKICPDQVVGSNQQKKSGCSRPVETKPSSTCSDENRSRKLKTKLKLDAGTCLACWNLHKLAGQFGKGLTIRARESLCQPAGQEILPGEERPKKNRWLKICFANICMECVAVSPLSVAIPVIVFRVPFCITWPEKHTVIRICRISNGLYMYVYMLAYISTFWFVGFPWFWQPA